MSGISPNATKLGFKDLSGRVAIITGASRGIGRECALALARQGCNIVVAAKSTKEQPNLPGTIYTVADEVQALGAKALPYQLDVRDHVACEKCVEKTVEEFGRVDIFISNASALWWHDIVDTPMNKYELMQSLNCKGPFAITKACMPHFLKGGFGRVITMSPPIATNFTAFKGFTGYNISKMGMTMVAMGTAAEGVGKDITGHSLWPATVIESQASINFQLGEPENWRKATILADAVVSLVCEEETYTGKQLIDDTYLRYKGLTDEDLAVYRYDPNVEPPRALAMGIEAEKEFVDLQGKATSLKRGDVRQLEKNKADAQTRFDTPSKL